MALSGLIDIYNLALNKVGARDNLSLPTEQSREAEVCNLWYTVVRDQVLASAPWPEATSLKYLSLLSEASDTTWAQTDPRPGYLYAYALPSDYLRAQYLTDFNPFLVTNYQGTQLALHTNMTEAILAYTIRLEQFALWGAELQTAIIVALAANICMPLSGKRSRARDLIQEANAAILAARESAANTSTEQFEHMPDWIAARGGTIQTASRFFYPLGGLLTVPNVN